MTTAVLRPNSTITAADSETGAASDHDALSDDLDTSYVTDDDTIEYGLGTVTIGAGSIIKQIRYRFRGRADSTTAYTRVNLVSSLGSIVGQIHGPINASLANYSSAYVPASSFQSVIDTVGAQDLIDALYIEINPGYGVLGLGADALRVYEAYVDLVYVTIPVVAVDTVTDPYTASTLVPISWVNTLDTDGGGQTRYEVKVYTDAQYGAGGFDPDTSTPFYETEVVTSSLTSVDVGPLPNSDTYRAYVRVAQTVNGSSHWSDWDYDEFTLNVTTVDVDTVVATANNTTASISVEVTRDSADGAWGYVEVQRSNDAGATWADVRRATYVVPDDADTFVVVDYESPNGVSATYRARATYLSSGLPITSAWVESNTTAWTSTDCWLKAPNDQTLNTTFLMSARNPYGRNRRAGVFRPLGSAAAVTITDVRSKRNGVLTVETTTADEAADLDALLEGADVLLVQFPTSMDIADKYAAILSDEELFRSVVADNVWREWALEYVEVASPADPDAGR